MVIIEISGFALVLDILHNLNYIQVLVQWMVFQTLTIYKIGIQHGSIMNMV